MGPQAEADCLGMREYIMEQVKRQECIEYPPRPAGTDAAVPQQEEEEEARRGKVYFDEEQERLQLTMSLDSDEDDGSLTPGTRPGTCRALFNCYSSYLTAISAIEVLQLLSDSYRTHRTHINTLYSSLAGHSAHFRHRQHAPSHVLLTFRASRDRQRPACSTSRAGGWGFGADDGERRRGKEDGTD
eukprot:1717324-Rhodomonas_salina.1